MKILSLSDILYTSWSELPKRRRWRVMILIPFLNDPYAKLIILREISRTKEAYKLIQSLPNSAEIVVDIFDKGIPWLTDHPREFVFPEIMARNWVFHTPEDNFEDLTMEELTALEITLNKFLRFELSKSTDAIMHQSRYFHIFLSHLYRVHQEGTGDKLKAIAALPYPYQLDALRMYSSLRDRIFKKFNSLFPASEPSEKSTSKVIDFKKIQDNTAMWQSIMIQLADSPAFQGMETAKAAPIFEALTYLDEKAFQAIKAKQELDNQRKAYTHRRK